jgi:uncharacterized protein (DUF2141 family)
LIGGVVLTATEPATPVRGARVTVNSLDSGGAADTATTDEQGRFLFRNLPAGRYAIQSTKRAWLDANYGAPRLGRPGTPVAVRDGEARTDLAIRMARGAVITGVVRNPAGEPEPGVRIRVMRFVAKDGLRSLERPVSMNLNDPTTDDDGVYRAYGLPPGDYIVLASLSIGDDTGLGGDEIRRLSRDDVDRLLASGPRSALTPPAPPHTSSVAAGTVTHAPVYFPGTTDMASAQTVTVNAGEERTGLDIPFALYPTARVTGVVTFPGGELKGRIELRITPVGYEDLLMRPVAAAIVRTASDGRFSFAGIPPGRYTIVCATGDPPVLAGWGEASVVVTGVDQDIAIAMAPPPVVFGRVEFDGAAPPKDPTSAVRIDMRGVGRARLLKGTSDARPKPDGTFAFTALVPGPWAVGATLPPRSPWALQAVTLGARDILDTTIDLAPGDRLTDLVIRFTDRPSELTGSLVDATGRAASEYFVIAFSTDRAAWTPTSRRIQSVRPASDGVYSIKGLPAGDYYLAALTDVEPGEWLSTSFLDQIVPAAVRVRLADAQRTTQSLRIGR